MIQIKNVSFRYKGAGENSISNVSLEIKEGECILLSGRSGCGKTTLLRLINGLIPHYYEGSMEGEVFLKNRAVEKLEMYEIAEMVGTIYQNPRAQFFNIDSDSEILFGIENMAYPKKELQERFQKTVQDTGVEKLLGKNLFWLSGGEKQKIAFASVYAMQPEIYLMDEPSANLDEKAIEKLQKQIERLKKQGKTIVITEHRLFYLEKLADRVIYFENGMVKQEYSGKDFFELEEEKRKQMGLRVLKKNSATFTIYPPCNSLAKERTEKTLFLEIKEICARHQKREILHHISFQAAAGDIIAVTGRNGAGKSTMVESICGLKKLSSGEIRCCNLKWNEKKRSNAGYMVSQDVDYQLFANSVRNECSYGMCGIKEEEIACVLEQMQLQQKMETHPALLSGGQKQRLAVAVSLLCNKSILFFDEPTSGLDYDSMCRVSELLKELAKQEKIIFVVTHDEELIQSTCNRVLTLEEGRLKADYKIV